MERRKNWGTLSGHITILNTTFIFVDPSKNPPEFIVTKDGEKTEITLRGRDKDHLQDLYDEMNHVASFNQGDIVDVVVSPCDWEVGRNSGTTYFLVSIKRSDNV